MLNSALKEAVCRSLGRVKTPAQYTGGELHSVVKDHRQVRGKLCLAFPDTYMLGMSHHGLQVLYSIMNADPREPMVEVPSAFPSSAGPWMEAELMAQSPRMTVKAAVIGSCWS